MKVFKLYHKIVDLYTTKVTIPLRVYRKFKYYHEALSYRIKNGTYFIDIKNKTMSPALLNMFVSAGYKVVQLGVDFERAYRITYKEE